MWKDDGDPSIIIMSRTNAKASTIYKAAVSLCVSVCVTVPPPLFDTTVWLQRNLAHICGLVWESFEPKQIRPTPPQRVPWGILGGQQFKGPGNVMNRTDINTKNYPPPRGGSGCFRGKQFKCPGNVINCLTNRYFFEHPVGSFRGQNV